MSPKFQASVLPAARSSLLVAATSAGYLALAKTSIMLADGVNEIAPFWPPNGFLLAILLLSKSSLRIPMLLFSLVGTVIANLGEGRTLLPSLGFALANALEVVLAHQVVLSLAGGRRFFEHLRGVFGFLAFVAVGCSALSGLMAAVVASTQVGTAFLNAWATWFIADLVGLAITTPFLLAWLSPGRASAEGRRYWTELALALASTAAVSILVFSGHLESAWGVPAGLPYSVFPFLIWAALRCGSRGATAAMMVLYMVAAWFSSRGTGPFAAGEAPTVVAMLAMQAFTFSALFSSLIPSAILCEHNRAEERMRRSESRFRAIEEGNLLGIFVGRKGAIFEANQKFLDLVGYTREDLEAGRINSERMTPADNSEALSKMQKTYAALGKVGPCERDFIRKDGARIHTFMSGARIDEDGTGLAIVYDITELKRTREAFRQAKDETEAARRTAEEANLAKTRFLAAMSHEIRTPLNGILGMTSLLVDTPLRPEQKSFAGIIKTSGEHLLALINQVLDFSKIEDGKIELQRTEFDLIALVEGAQQFILEKSQGKGLELVTRIEPGSRQRFLGDPLRLQQVLLNLLSNAVKFSDRGYVLISAEVVDSGEASVEMLFEVADQGVGIAEADQERIFEPFRQANSGSDRVSDGTGLGLSICRNLIHQMGGKIWVESEPGKGSSFKFTVRLGTAGDGSKNPLPTVTGDSKGIALIWEENFHARFQLKEILAGYGIDCEYLPDLDSLGWSLKSVRLRNPSAIPFAVIAASPQDSARTDTLIRLLRERASLDCPVLLAAPFISQAQSLPLLRSGASGIFTKPYRSVQVGESLADAIPGLLPSSPSKGMNPAEAGQSQPAWFKRPRILIVDDHPVNLEVAAAMLGKLGCEADTVESGQDALVMMEWKEYDLLLMDCEMPVMDGFETTRRIRAAEGGKRRIPIAALTAHAIVGARERCLAAGMDDYLAKPFAPQQLAIILMKWIPLLSAEGAPLQAPIRPAETLEEGPVDWTRLKDMGESPEDRENIRNLVSLFKRTTRSSLESLSAMRSSPDLPAARKTLHKLKGSCSTLGARRMAAIIQDFERVAQEEERDRFEPLLEGLEQAFKDTSVLLDARTA